MSHPAIERADSVLAELYKFSSEAASLGPSVGQERFTAFAGQLFYELPIDFVYILSRHNSFDVAGTHVYGLGPELGAESLDQVHQFEHSEVEYPMPPYYLAFSPDGAGNHYCLDLSRLREGTCPVVFWQHDAQYVDLNEVETCNDSFSDWVQEVMIDWALEAINYDGSEK